MNLVFVAIDTLRADHLSCYGYAKPTSPNLDALAVRGMLFERFYSVGNCTHPGFTAMLSGLHPESTGVVNHWTLVDPPDEIPMMAEYFQRAGYETCAVDNLYDNWATRYREYPWFRRGYEHYGYAGDAHTPAENHVALACEWLERGAREPFMMFLHLWDPHAPYTEAPEEFYRFYDGEDPCDPRLDYMPPVVRAALRESFGMPLTDPGYVAAAYDAEIAYTDHCLGILFDKIDALKLADETIILVTADHGEIMSRPRLCGGRPWCFSHIGLFEDCLRIPLIVAGGGVERGRSAEAFQLVDIVPTLIEMFGLAQDIELDGMSMAPALSGGEVNGREALFFSENTYQKQRGAIRWPWKYTRFEEENDSMPRRGLYHLERDPAEVVNLVDSVRDEAAAMDELINDHVRRTVRGGADPLREQKVSQSLRLTPEQIRY